MARPRINVSRGATGAAPLTAFVFAGGTSLAATQAGMLQALYERGIVPDLLVGTSAGALNAAFVASRPHTLVTAKQLGDVWRGLRREEAFPISPRRLISGLTNHSDHLVSDSGLLSARRILASHPTSGSDRLRPAVRAA